MSLNCWRILHILFFSFVVIIPIYTTLYVFTKSLKTLKIKCYNIGILVLVELSKYFHCAYMIWNDRCRVRSMYNNIIIYSCRSRIKNRKLITDKRTKNLNRHNIEYNRLYIYFYVYLMIFYHYIILLDNLYDTTKKKKRMQNCIPIA